MKKTLKIFCCVLAVCSVNVGVVKADTINNEELWETFQEKRENIISKIIIDEGAEVKGVYFSSHFEEEKDKRLWQDGKFLVKMNITKKQSENIFEDIVKKIWHGERWFRDLEKEPLTEEELESLNKNKMDEMEKYYYSPLGMSVKEKIESRYTGGMDIRDKSIDEDGTIHTPIGSRIEEIVTVNLSESKDILYYQGGIYRRSYENIINAVAGESKIRINSKDYDLNSSITLSNGTMYIPEDGVKIILDRYGKEIDSQLSSVCKEIDGINYYPYRNVINAGEDNTNQIFFDLDTKMASSLSMNLSEARDTVFGLFYD